MIALPFGEPLRYDDLRRMPDDGHRYELLDGALLVTPAPGTAHQVCVIAMADILRRYRRPRDVVLVAPFDYVVSSATVLEPDVLVARRNDLGDANLCATPLLVVEVLSPSTRRVDCSAKRLAYEEAGVPSYWIVDPEEVSVSVLELVGDRYEERVVIVGDDSYETSLPFAVLLTPARLLDDLK